MTIRGHSESQTSQTSNVLTNKLPVQVIKINKINNEQNKVNNSCLKIIHQNVRAITSKKNKIEAVLKELEPDIYVATETFLYDYEAQNIKYDSIYHYATSFCRNTSQNRGGGISIFINSSKIDTWEAIDMSCHCIDSVIEICAEF